MSRLSLNVRKQIVDSWLSVKGISFRQIAKQLNTSHQTVSAVIKKYGEELTFKDLPRPGRKIGSYNKNIDRKVRKLIESKRSLSVREIAKKCGNSPANVQEIKKRHNLKTYKKQRIPKRSQKQQAVAKNRARKLYEEVLINFKGCVLMDDETYVKLDGSTLPGPQFYTKKKGEPVSDSFSSIPTEKFGEKVLVWQAICSCGNRTSSFFTKGTINSKNYIDECLKKRILPFIKKHEGAVLFWPDLASAHYAKTTVSWYEVNNVRYVNKLMNPPNCPFLRPIERYWAQIKGILRKQGKDNKNLDEFKKTWVSATKKLSESSVRTLMQGVKSKVRKFVKNEK